jgi:hypothetical protein
MVQLSMAFDEPICVPSCEYIKAVSSLNLRHRGYEGQWIALAVERPFVGLLLSISIE